MTADPIRAALKKVGATREDAEKIAEPAYSPKDYPMWARAGFGLCALLDWLGMKRAAWWLACKVGWYSHRTMMERWYRRYGAAAVKEAARDA